MTVETVNALVKLDEFRALLHQITTVDEAKQIRDQAEALRVYTKQRDYSLECQNECADVKVRAERRIGELLPDSITKGGSPKSHDVTLADLGIDKKQSSRCQSIASIPESVFEAHIQEVKASGEELTTAGILRVAAKLHDNRIVNASESNEWYTPAEYIEAAREVMGGIDLDPASCEVANRIVGAADFYCAEDDGLSQPWSGRIWLNPPYGDDGPQFVAKLVKDFTDGKVEQAVLLVNSHCTDAKWFQPLWNHTLCFTDHRIDFWRPAANGANSTHGSVFVYFGINQQSFLRCFGQFGAVVARLL